MATPDEDDLTRLQVSDFPGGEHRRLKANAALSRLTIHDAVVRAVTEWNEQQERERGTADAGKGGGGAQGDPA